MRSTFFGVEVAKRSLFAQQTGLQVTAHNIGNANTRGYTRQTVNLVAARPLEPYGMMRSTIPGQTGTGVELHSITRIREKFLDDQYYQENHLFGDWSVRRDTMEKLEAIFNEPSETGLRTVIEKFWEAWQELSKGADARSVVKERAVTLVNAFQQTARQLNDLRNDLTENLSVMADKANSILSQIAELNRQIARIEGLGDNANDLRDRRDVLVDDLSKMMNITVNETDAGYIVSMGGVQLVNGQTVNVVLDANFFANSANAGDLNSGQVHGMLVSLESVDHYRLQLDAMVKGLVEGEVTVTLPKGTVLPEGTVLNGVTYSGANRTLQNDLQVTVKGLNELHQLGYADKDPLQSGVPFFVLKPGATEFTAETIEVNPAILSDVNLIASSLRTYVDNNGNEKVVRGNYDLAIIIAGLRHQTIQFDPNQTGQTVIPEGSYDEFYRRMIGELGIQTEETIRQEENQRLLVEQIDMRRQSVSGVSLDEEMANMMKYQHAYNAAARVLTAVDEVLNKLINGTGVVGR